MFYLCRVECRKRVLQCGHVLEGRKTVSSVISATTRKAYGAAVQPSRRDAFLAAAEQLLAAADREMDTGAIDLAMEYAYRAALRIAGAVNADSAVLRKRKRLPTSAWDKLALTGAQGQMWAARLQTFSGQRGRVASGLDQRPDPVIVQRLLDTTKAFYLEVHPGEVPTAA